MASPKRGRKPDPIPKDELQSLLLSEFGPEVARFFHRDAEELRAVYDAWAFGEYPQMPAAKVEEIENLLRKHGLPKREFEGIKDEVFNGRRNRWQALIGKRFEENDTEFSELLALVRANPRPKKLTVPQLVRAYVNESRIDGQTPTEAGFIRWLREVCGALVGKHSRTIEKDARVPLLVGVRDAGAALLARHVTGELRRDALARRTPFLPSRRSRGPSSYSEPFLPFSGGSSERPS